VSAEDDDDNNLPEGTKPDPEQVTRKITDSPLVVRERVLRERIPAHSPSLPPPPPTPSPPHGPTSTRPAAPAAALSTPSSLPDRAGALELHAQDTALDETPLRAEALPPAVRERNAGGVRTEGAFRPTSPAALLAALAAEATGDARAELLVACAEEHELAGRLDDARACLDEAVGTAPQHRFALRSERRMAERRRDWNDCRTFAERLGSLECSAAEQTETEALLAWLDHVEHSAIDGTHPREAPPTKAPAKPSAAANADAPRSFVGALLAANRRRAAGENAAAAALLDAAAKRLSHGPLVAALLSESADLLEAEDGTAAESRYARALHADADAVDARLGLARNALLRGTPDLAAATLLQAASRAGSTREREAFLRLASRALLWRSGAPKDALTCLMTVEGAAGLTARLDAARASSPAQHAATGAAPVDAIVANHDLERQTLELLLAAGVRGMTRTRTELSLLECELRAPERNEPRARLRELTASDDTRDAVRLLTELYGAPGDDARGAAEGDTFEALEDACEALAKSLPVPRASGSSPPRERQLLATALNLGLGAQIHQALALDSLMESRDFSGVHASLLRAEERGAPAWNAGMRAALADQAASVGLLDEATAQLTAGAEAHGHGPTVAFALALRLAPSRPRDAVSELLRSLEQSPPGLGAALGVTAARMVEGFGGDPEPALQLALDEVPRYAPAIWLLTDSRTQRGATSQLAELLVDFGRSAPGPFQKSLHLVRAALLRLSDDRAHAASLIEEARSNYGSDMFLFEMALTYGTQLPAADRAVLLEHGIGPLDSPWTRALSLRAASYWGAAGELGRAAEIYRRFARNEDLLAKRGLDRIESAMGETARVGARRFADLKGARGRGAKIAALESLADLERFDRGDAASALVSVHAILEIDPGHLPALRTLLSHHMEQRRFADMATVLESILEVLSDPRDIRSHLRLGVRALQTQDTSALDSIDRMVLGHWERATPDLWVARQAVASTRRAGDPKHIAHATAVAASLLDGEVERSETLRLAAEAWRHAGEVDKARDAAEEALRRYPMHPDVGELLGELWLVDGPPPRIADPRRAAEAFEAAASWSATPERATPLWFRAARLWQDVVRDRSRTRACLERVVELQPRYEDAYERLASLLQREGDLDRLREITEMRIEAGGENPVLAALHLTLAHTSEALGEDEASLRALRRAAVLDPERAGTWKQLAVRYRARQDWRGAADALIHTGRLERNPEALREIFLSLGDIYADRMQDFTRAESAYRRATQLHRAADAEEKLAAVLERTGERAAAVEVIDSLLAHAPAEKRVDYVTWKARLLEAMGDVRAAEEAIESERRASPTNMPLVQQLVGLYERRGARAAVGLHLSRTAEDLREAFEADLDADTLLPKLVDVFLLRGRKDAARVTASVAAAFGSLRVDFADLLDDHGGLEGGGRRAFGSDLDSLLLPETVPPPAQACLRTLGPAFEAVHPINLGTLGASRVPGHDPRVRASLAAASAIIDREVILFESDRLSRVCVPLRDRPLEVLVGRQLLESATDEERVFLWLRAAKIGLAGFGAVARLDTVDFAQALAATGAVLGIDVGALPKGKAATALRNQVERALPKRERTALESALRELLGWPGYSAAALADGVADFGARTALLAQGSVPAGLGALLKMAGIARPMTGRPDVRRAAITRADRARALVLFALSEEHFEARVRTGADESEPVR
jgi:tetratricopeptide (TPR) repeat protein